MFHNDCQTEITELMDNGLLFCDECIRCVPNQIIFKSKLTKNSTDLDKHYKTRYQKKCNVDLHLSNSNDSDQNVKKKKKSKSYSQKNKNDSDSNSSNQVFKIKNKPKSKSKSSKDK